MEVSARNKKFEPVDYFFNNILSYCAKPFVYKLASVSFKISRTLNQCSRGNVLSDTWYEFHPAVHQTKSTEVEPTS